MINNMMNPMIMNPMLMNPIVNNNQMNMDQTSMNIKNIVKPYEDKIKALEEIIRQKDFEITVLKQKLNNNNSNINFMNMNINPMIMNQNMNPMMISGNNNQLLEDKGEAIDITIKLDNNEYPIKCFTKDKVSTIKQKFNLNDKGLTYHYKCLDDDWTFGENGIMNSSVIYANYIMNITFHENTGKKFNLCLSKDCPLGLAIIYYLIKSGNSLDLLSILNGIDNVYFLFNGSELNVKDTTPIENVLKSTFLPRITVIFK